MFLAHINIGRLRKFQARGSEWNKVNLKWLISIFWLMAVRIHCTKSKEHGNSWSAEIKCLITLSCIDIWNKAPCSKVRSFGNWEPLVFVWLANRVRISACVTTLGRRNDLWTISSGQGRVEVNSEKYCLFPFSIPVRTTEKSLFQLRVVQGKISSHGVS